MSTVYLILGAADSGRAELMTQMIRTGLSPDDGPFGIHHASSDAMTKPEAYATLAILPATTVTPLPGEWPCAGVFPATIPGTNTLLVSLDGHADPLDQIEATKHWITEEGHTLARIITEIGRAHV